MGLACSITVALLRICSFLVNGAILCHFYMVAYVNHKI